MLLDRYDRLDQIDNPDHRELANLLVAVDERDQLYDSSEEMAAFESVFDRIDRHQHTFDDIWAKT